jgi:protein involved in polysaccharide export with SLBB domain
MPASRIPLPSGWLTLCLATLLGCGGGCSAGFTLFPTGSFLETRTQEIVASARQLAGVPRELNKSVLPAYYVQPGDTLLIEPVALDSTVRLPGDQVVLVDGTIDLGEHGRIVVAGMTVEDIEMVVQQRVEAGIAGDEEQKAGPINVRLLDAQGAVYYVLGEVNAPGAYPLIGRETVLDGIVMAGGLTDRASPCDLVLSRPTPPAGCRVVLPVCYREITQMGDTTSNYQLRPGDRIYVGTVGCCEQLFFWRARQGCELCNASPQCPCPDPNLAVATGPDFVLAPPVTAVGMPPGSRLVQPPTPADAASPMILPEPEAPFPAATE